MRMSDMWRSGELICHGNADRSYVLAINPSKWMLILAGRHVLGNAMPEGHAEARAQLGLFPKPSIDRFQNRRIFEELHKATDPVIFNEYRVLRASAERYSVDAKCVRVVITDSTDSVNAILELISEHTLIQEIPNDSLGRIIATTMTTYVWVHDVFGPYSDWFKRTFITEGSEAA